MAEEGRERTQSQHADRRICAHSVVGGVSGVGLGDEGQRAGPRSVETVRIGDGVEWAHSSDIAKGGGKRDILFRDVDRISSTGSRRRAGGGADESAGRTA